MIETSYLPQSRFSRMELKEFVSDSMYEFLKRTYDFSPEKAVENFRPVMPLPYEKELLQIYGNVPCMLLERFTYEKDGSGGLKSPEKAVENFRPVMPLPYEKELLQIYGNVPCMLLERFTYEKDGSGGLKLAEYTRSVIRGDKFMFQVELE